MLLAWRIFDPRVDADLRWLKRVLLLRAAFCIQLFFFYKDAVSEHIQTSIETRGRNVLLLRMNNNGDSKRPYQCCHYVTCLVLRILFGNLTVYPPVFDPL